MRHRIRRRLRHRSIHTLIQLLRIVQFDHRLPYSRPLLPRLPLGISEARGGCLLAGGVAGALLLL